MSDQREELYARRHDEAYTQQQKAEISREFGQITGGPIYDRPGLATGLGPQTQIGKSVITVPSLIDRYAGLYNFATEVAQRSNNTAYRLTGGADPMKDMPNASDKEMTDLQKLMMLADAIEGRIQDCSRSINQIQQIL